MAELVVMWLGLAIAAAVIAVWIPMAIGHAVVVPARVREPLAWACMAVSALEFVLIPGEAELREPTARVPLHPDIIGVPLLMISLMGGFIAALHLHFVYTEDHQARRAGDRAQRAVLARLRDLGIEATVSDCGLVDWGDTTRRLEVGLAACAAVGLDPGAGPELARQCRLLRDTHSVRPLRIRSQADAAREDLNALATIASRPPKSHTPSR